MKSEIGCVIMASGLAKRFGSNKLLAEFDRKPLLCRAFAVTEGLHRVVVARSTEVQALCEKYGIPVLHHTHPLRSDTVRLGLEYLLPRFPAMSGCVFADEGNALRYDIGILRGTRLEIADFSSVRTAKRYAGQSRAVRRGLF